jgi:hypothetical protein
MAYLVYTPAAQPGRFGDLAIGHPLTVQVLNDAAAQPPQLCHVPLSLREALSDLAEQADRVFYRRNPLNLVRHA